MAKAEQSVHRIYQGRALRLLREHDGQWAEVADGLELIWRHHDLFQRAVNYYLLALASIATDPRSPVGRMREQMCDCWNDFRRRGETREGMRASLSPVIGDHPDAESAMRAVLEGSAVAPAVLQAAIDQLVGKLGGEAAIQQQGRAYWPRFCHPETNANFAGDPVMMQRAEDQKRLPVVVHDPATTFDSLSLDCFDVYSIATPNNQKPLLTGTEAKARLEAAVKDWENRRPGDAKAFKALRKKVADLPELTTLPNYVGSSAKGEVKLRLFALLLFKYVERSEFTFGLLRESTPKPTSKPGKKAKAVPAETAAAVDPVREARGDRGYVFRAFTALPAFGGTDGAIPTWSEFDIAAFKEALKTINQINGRQMERDEKRSRSEAQLAFVRDGDGSPSVFAQDDGEEDEDSLPGTLQGDPRTERLRRLLEEELSVANELTAGERASYFLRTRTLRGAEQLFAAWNKHLEGSARAGSADLIAICDEHQQKHPDDMGSVVLFRALAQPDCWCLWRSPTAEEAAERARHRWSNRLLNDYALSLELAEEVEELKRPISFTPADPQHSRRLYTPSDLNGEFEAVHLRTDAGPLVEMGIAVRDGEHWRAEKVRVAYAAPRLRRDGLADGRSRWLPPMLAPLLGDDVPQKGIDGAAVQLMPDRSKGRLRVLINFPVALDIEKVREAIGISRRWGPNQLNGLYKEKKLDRIVHLFWPDSDRLRGGRAHADWWNEREPWSVLGVDLGQRTAAACARLRVTPDVEPIYDKGWWLGEAGGVHWNARLERTALLRVAGEDLSQWDGEQWRREHGGRRGRKAGTIDRDEALSILGALPWHRVDATELGGRTAPEVNDLLLVAIRQAQGWFSRLHRWRWLLAEPDRRGQVVEEMGSHPAANTVEPDVSKASFAALVVGLDREIRRCAETIPAQLLLLTSRILPLRTRAWAWEASKQREGCHVLRQVERTLRSGRVRVRGQRGMSFARLEQVEELRTRWQSLNRTLMRAPGQKPPSGREMRNDPVPDPCPDLLVKLDRLKQQRINQTAHMIVAEALGVQLVPPAMGRAARLRDDRHGEYCKRRTPVACVVLEDLSRYRSSQDRGPAENSRLMKWCHAAVRDKVKTLCEPLGIQVVEVGAAYSSRFCSRTGVAGFRAVEVNRGDKRAFAWRRHIERYEASKAEGKVQEEDRVVAETFAALDRMPVLSGKPPRTLLLPKSGGPVFVPMRDWPPVERQDKRGRVSRRIPSGVQQADVNAAINIGLRAIASPTADRIHLRVRLTSKDGAWLACAGARPSIQDRARWSKAAVLAEGAALGSGSHINAFWDWGGVSSFESIAVGELRLASGKGLWSTVKQSCWRRVEEINKSRLRAWDDTEVFPY